jgi:NodT family efflux transporter outer membrane factor (OMF) lipoprotein
MTGNISRATRERVGAIAPKSRRNARRTWLTCALSALPLFFAGGCAVGPDFHLPDFSRVSSYTSTPLPEKTASAPVPGGAAQHFAPGAELPAQWWTLFRSEPLNRMIEEALRASPTLEAADAALRQAQEMVYAQRGFFYPTVQASFSPSRQRNAVGTLAPNLSSGQPTYNLYTSQLGIGYTPDIFGANRRQVESLQASAEAQRFQLHAAYVTLTTNVTSTVIQEAALRAQIAATESIIEIQRDQQRLLQRQFNAGAIARTDLVAQEALLAQTLATLPPLQKQLSQQRHLLTALLGRLPSDEPVERFELASLELPQELPLGVPSRLVEQRPDVRAAEGQLHAASAQIGVATANMLPLTTITAAMGGVSTNFAQMFSAGNIFWGVGSNVAQTLFAGGTLKHRKKAAEAAYDQAAAQYKGTVITAFQNVADTLRALEFDAEALSAQVVAERAARQNLEFANKAVMLGAASRLGLLSAQQTYQQALLNGAQARANRYVDTVALFQALGGGWWNRSDLPVPSDGV